MVYVGDALYEGGNDAIVKETGISTIQVDRVRDTKFFVHAILLFIDSKKIIMLMGLTWGK